MKNKYKISIGILVILSIFLIACSEPRNSDSNGEEVKGLSKEIVSLKTEIQELKSDNKILEEENRELNEQVRELENQEVNNTNNESSNNSLIVKSMEVMELIKNKDMEELGNHVHPNEGLRFTPYFYIDTENDQVFTSQEVKDLNTDTNQYDWGSYDGTGNPINLNFQDYYNEFVYDENFIDPHIIGNNTPIGIGNTLDNIDEKYPMGEYIEFHFTGFEPEYEGIDWKSLRLVFKEDGGVLYLVGIIHGQWTI